MSNSERLFDLRGKVAVVSGGAGLIGRELVRGLAQAGATTIVAEINRAQGQRLARRLKREGLDVIFRPLDITKEKSVSNLIKFITDRHGRIDIWVNSAYPKTADWGTPLEDIRLKSWRKNIDMHLNGYFICCQKAIGHMKQRRRGVIVNLSSIYGMVGPDFSIYKGTDMTVPAAYSAIKGALITFTRYLAAYCGKYNIRVNCISPGGVYDGQPELFAKRYAKRTVLGRMAKADDVVGAMLYLVSDAASYITGHNLVVDGGWSIS